MLNYTAIACVHSPWLLSASAPLFSRPPSPRLLPVQHTMLGRDDEPGLYLLAAADIFEMLLRPQHGEMQLHVASFEIYGGKVFDLLAGRTVRAHAATRGLGRQVLCWAVGNGRQAANVPPIHWRRSMNSFGFQNLACSPCMRRASHRPLHHASVRLVPRLRVAAYDSHRTPPPHATHAGAAGT